MGRLERAIAIATLVALALAWALVAIHCPAWEVLVATALVFANQLYWSYRQGGDR